MRADWKMPGWALALALMSGGCSQDAGNAPRDASTGDSSSTTNADADSDTDSDTGDAGADTDSDTCAQPDAIESCEDGWCLIPAGCFRFGSPTSEPCRAAYEETQVYVTLTHPFLISATETTQEQWTAMGFPNPSPPPQCADCPLSMVNWYETLAYCNALSASQGLDSCYDLSCCEGVVGEGCEEGVEFCGQGFICSCSVHRYANVYECPGYRLPTVAEWEYATRAGTTTNTYNGQSESDTLWDCAPNPVIDEIAWSCSNATQAMAVGLKTKNAWGLHDSIGNLQEWCSDPVGNASLGGGAEHVTDPHGFVSEASQGRPLRGSHWMADPCYCTSSWEGSDFIDVRWILSGFRPVRTVFGKGEPRVSTRTKRRSGGRGK